MDQSCLVGVGNIYATEALWTAKIHPLTALNRLSDASLRLLYRSILDILKKAIAARGTSADDYLDAHGRAGGYDKKLQVYGRAGELCVRCRTVLNKIRVAGRGTTFCPKCQKITN
jgi:formamidopyrimidine-DNA glycosylase